jgi:hypothetical protein
VRVLARSNLHALLAVGALDLPGAKGKFWLYLRASWLVASFTWWRKRIRWDNAMDTEHVAAANLFETIRITALKLAGVHGNLSTSAAMALAFKQTADSNGP